MIKEEPQGTAQTNGINAADVEHSFNTPRVRTRQGRSRWVLKIPMRRGVSQRVLRSAKRLMKEYQSDLDYLKDK